MNLGKAFSYPFEDQDWLKKVGIAGLAGLIPIVGTLIVGGWGLEVTRRVIDHDPSPLPDWSDFSGHFVRGLKMFVVGFVYALPAILISACQQTLSIMMQNNNDDTTVMALSAVVICASCLSLIYSIFLGLVLPAAFARLAVSGQIGDGLRFAEVIGLVRAAPGAYVLALVGGFLASLVAMLGVILCVIGVLFTIAYAILINSHLYGQAYNEAIALKGSAAAAY